MENLSMALFRLEGGMQLSVETSRVHGMARVVIHDTAEKHFGKDVVVSMPLEHARNISKAVDAFNREMGAADAD